MIVARERKGLKIQGARSADRRRHTRRYVNRLLKAPQEAERVYPGDSATYTAAADRGEKSGLKRRYSPGQITQSLQKIRRMGKGPTGRAHHHTAES